MRLGALTAAEIKSQLFCDKRMEKTRHQVVTKTSRFLPSSGTNRRRKSKAGKGFYFVEFKIHTVEVIGSNPIAPTNFIFVFNPIQGAEGAQGSNP